MSQKRDMGRPEHRYAQSAVKERAAAVLEQQGMTISDAVRVLLTRTANEGAVPFTPVQSAAYDAWFRSKVQEALDDPRPMISMEEVDRRADVRRSRLLAKAQL